MLSAVCGVDDRTVRSLNASRQNELIVMVTNSLRTLNALSVHAVCDPLKAGLCYATRVVRTTVFTQTNSLLLARIRGTFVST